MASRRHGPGAPGARTSWDEPREVMEQLLALLGDSSTESEEILDLTEVLERVVDQRLEFEEDSGHLEEALVQAPWLAGAAQELRQRHLELRQMVRQIGRGSGGGECPPARRRRLQGQLSELLERYLEHNLAKENLIQEAYRMPSWLID